MAVISGNETGVAAKLNHAPAGLRRAGTARVAGRARPGTQTLAGIHPLAVQTPLPLLEMYTRGITVHTSRADSRRYLPDVLAMVAAGRIDPLAVPTTVIGWDDAAEHWLDPGLKIVVTR